MIAWNLPSSRSQLPIRLSKLEQMLPLSYDLFAWLCRTGIEHQPGPSETRMPWGISVPNLPHARPNSSHETCNSSGTSAATHGPRMSRSRSPAPAMIPQAHAPDTSHDTRVLMHDSHILDDAREDDGMPSLYDEYTEQV